MPVGVGLVGGVVGIGKGASYTQFEPLERGRLLRVSIF